ncbi:EpsG family protein [Morganella morganii]
MKKHHLLCILSFIINPVLSLLMSLNYFFKGKNTSVILSLSLSLIFSYQPLMYDTSANFFKLISSEPNNLYNIIPYFFKTNLNIDYYYFILLYTFIIFWCWFSMIYIIGKNVRHSSRFLLIVFLGMISIIYRDIMDLNRFYLSISIVFFSIIYSHYYLKSKINLLIVLLSTIAFFIHQYSILILFSYILGILIKSTYLYILYLSCAVLVGFFFDGFIINIASNIELLSSYHAYFGTGIWGNTTYSNATLIRKIFEVVLISNITYILIKLKLNTNDEIINLCLIICGFCFIFFSFKTFFERTLISLLIIYIYIFSLDIKKSLTISLLLVLITTKFFLINFYRYGDVFIYGHTDVLPNTELKIEMQFKPFYYPTIFLIDFNNGYSDNFIISNSIWKQE